MFLLVRIVHESVLSGECMESDLRCSRNGVLIANTAGTSTSVDLGKALSGFARLEKDRNKALPQCPTEFNLYFVERR